MNLVQRAVYQRVINGAFAFILAIGSITALTPFIFSLRAGAVAVNPGAAGWVNESLNGGAATFVVDATAPAGVGALSLTTGANSTDKAAYFNRDTTKMGPLSAVGEISYSTKQISAGFVAGTPSFQLPVLLGGTTGFTTLVYEPYVSQGNAAVLNNTWQTWDVDQGRFYSTRSVSVGGSSVTGSQGSSTYTLAELKTLFPNANVIGFGVNVGSNNLNYNTRVDNLIYNGIPYDFEPIVPDTTRPEVSFVTPAAEGQALRGTAQISVQANDNVQLKTMVINVKDGANAGQLRTCGSVSGLTGTTYTLTCSLVTTDFADGSYYLRVGATDQANNNRTISRAFVIDNTNPTVAITSPAVNASVKGAFTINGTVNDATSGVDRVEIVVNKWVGGVFQGRVVDFAPATLNGNTFSYNVTGLPELQDGYYALRAIAYDKAGNSKTTGHNVTVDATKPIVQFVTPSEGSVNPTEIVIDATDETGLNRVTANIYDETNTTLIKSCSATAQPMAATSYQLNCAVSGLADGTYVIRTNASDLAGNIAQTLTRTFTVDTTAPAATIDAQSQPVVAGESITFTGTVLGDYSVLQLFFNGVPNDVINVINGVWSFTLDTTGLLPGAYDAEIIASDAAGNGSISSPTSLTTVAVVAPATPPADEDTDSEEVLGTDTDEPNAAPLSGRTPQTTNFGSVLGTASSEDDSQAAESAQQGEPDVAGAAIDVLAQADTDATDGTFLGLAWYWWVLIVGGLAALIGWIIAAARRRAGDA